MATRACSAAWSIGFKPEAVRVDGVATIKHPAIRRAAPTRKLPIWRCPASSPRRRLSHERVRFVPPPFLKYRFRFDPVISPSMGDRAWHHSKSTHGILVQKS